MTWETRWISVATAAALRWPGRRSNGPGIMLLSTAIERSQREQLRYHLTRLDGWARQKGYRLRDRGLIYRQAMQDGPATAERFWRWRDRAAYALEKAEESD